MASQSDMMQARWGSHGDYEIIALAPSSVQECFDFTIEAFNLSEEYRIPVMVMADEIVGHMREKIRIPEKVEIIKRKRPKGDPEEFIPFRADANGTTPMPPFGEGYNIPVTGLTHDEKGYPDASNPEGHEKLVKRLCDKILNHRKDIVRVKNSHTEDSEIITISYGAPSRSVATAVKDLRKKGQRVGYMKIDTPWPFPDDEVRKVAETADKLLVVEMNLGQIFYEVQRAADGMAEVELLPKLGGEIHNPDEIKAKIESMI